MKICWQETKQASGKEITLFENMSMIHARCIKGELKNGYVFHFRGRRKGTILHSLRSWKRTEGSKFVQHQHQNDSELDSQTVGKGNRYCHCAIWRTVWVFECLESYNQPRIRLQSTENQPTIKTGIIYHAAATMSDSNRFIRNHGAYADSEIWAIMVSSFAHMFKQVYAVIIVQTSE